MVVGDEHPANSMPRMRDDGQRGATGHYMAGEKQARVTEGTRG